MTSDMNRAIILHGTGNTSAGNWFQWLKSQLEMIDVQVWTPDLPGADRPSLRRYNEYLLSHCPWPVDETTIIVGHSSGSIAGLGLAQALKGQRDAVYLVSPCKDDLGWDSLKDLFDVPLDYAVLKRRSRAYVIFHSDNDPYCPLSHAEYFRDQLGATLHVIPKQGHFNLEVGPQYRQFPEIFADIRRCIGGK